MDLATALDRANEAIQGGDDATSQSFVALKTLHMAKVRLLLNSIDSLQTQIAKANKEGKDSQRSQMIQSLRNKLKDQELVADVLKEQLSVKAEMSIEDVNELIIRKTIGGPKRFRPLTREELENKVIDLERKVKKLQSAPAAAPVAKKASAVPRMQAPLSSGVGGAGSSSNEIVSKVGELMEQVEDLQRVVQAKDSLLLQCKGDMVQLRTRNMGLVQAEIANEGLEKTLVETKANYDKLLAEFSLKSSRHVELEEELLFVRDEVLMESESQAQLVEGLQDRCGKLVNQNTALLKRLHEMEAETESLQQKLDERAVDSSSAEHKSSVVSHGQTVLESKLAKLQEKIIELKTENGRLQQEASQTKDLKEALRDKNAEIREIQRNAKEMKRLRGAGGKDDSDAAESVNKRLVEELSTAVRENASLRSNMKTGVNRAALADLQAFTKEVLLHYTSALHLLADAHVKTTVRSTVAQIVSTAASTSTQESKEGGDSKAQDSFLLDVLNRVQISELHAELSKFEAR